MEKVLPVLQMVEEQRKANPPLEISQTTASEISVSSSIPDAHVEMLELIDSSTGHRLKGGHNTVLASSTVEAKLRDRKSTLLISATCLGSSVDDQDIARGSSSSASEEVSPKVVQREAKQEVYPDFQASMEVAKAMHVPPKDVTRLRMPT